jgi:glycosyltransferase involved in cell wall biosynthesis
MLAELGGATVGVARYVEARAAAARIAATWPSDGGAAPRGDGPLGVAPRSPMVSVVLCTRDRAQRVQRTLRSLHDMALPAMLIWEIVVVDNDSRDGTRDVVSAFARDARIPVRYVLETRPGLSWARNAGVQVSRGDILAFTDDDCLADPHWLERIDAEFRADAALAVLGGRVELHDSRDRPVAVRVHRDRVLVRSLDDIIAFMIGCNMACRRQLFADIGDFDVRLGSGAKIPSAEDWDLLYRAHRARAKIVFAPEVLVFHDHGRRSDADVESAGHRYAIGRWAFYCKYAARFDGDVVRRAMRDLWRLMDDIVRHPQIRPLIPVALGVTYWLGSLARPRSRPRLTTPPH